VERPELRLVRDPPPRHRALAAAGAGAAVLAAAALATALGADRARRPLPHVETAEAALAATLSGADPEAAGREIAALRARLRDAPLDGAARTTLANLMVETAGDDAARAKAAAQAVAATRACPTDEWVTRASARVLARCGREDEALAAIAAVFAYAPDQAAATLADVEPFVPEEKLARGLADTPEAWRAWSNRLRGLGRVAEADRRIEAALARWPDDLGTLLVAARVAAGRERVDELARLLPPSRALPATREAAVLFAYRARTHSGGEAVRADVATALALREDDPWVQVACGDALAALDGGAARAHWTRAVYALEAAGAPAASLVGVRLRLARLDDREGRGADALRSWRSILALRPDSEEARRRVAELSGGSVR
jgi:hypothetical protein